MADENLALLTANPEWALVLEAYRVREAEIRAAAAETQKKEGRGSKGSKKGAGVVAEGEASTPPPGEPTVAESPVPGAEPAAVAVAVAVEESGDSEEDSPGWSERIHEVAGVDQAALSGIHGRLIAFGFLKCEVGHRSAGLVYRPSNQGKSTLKSFQLAQSAPLAETA